ncbi:MAG TPA: hypothetical protein VIZ22_11940 [Candidatus Limnocylindrales bacterium]
MRTFRDPDDAIRAWLEEGPLVFPDQNERAIDVATQSMSQRRPAMRLPWRFPIMTTLPKVVAVGMAVVAVTLGGAMLLGQRSASPGVDANPTPSPTTAPSPSPSARASASLLDPTTWAPFTSERYGYSAAYPPDFGTIPSTKFWVIPESDSTSSAEWDMFGRNGTYDPTWSATSIRLPDGVTEDAWADAYRLTQDDPGRWGAACYPSTAPLSPVTIDGRTGSLRVGCGDIEALVVADGHMYSFGGWTTTTTTPGVPDEFRALFEAWLTTIKLDPASALEPPAASPSPR